MIEDNVAFWAFGVCVGMLLMAMLMQPHKHVDDFTHDIDNYDYVNQLLKKPAVEKGGLSAFAATEKDACPITHWNYFWSNLWARIRWWKTVHKHRPETTLERIKEFGEDETIPE